jgi:hypothetical protein
MAKVYAGVDSLRLSQTVGIGGLTADYRENTIVKFGSASFKPAGSGSGVFSSGSLQRTASVYNSSDQSSTRQYRKTGFFTNSYGPQYAWDCWVYLNSANSGKSGATATPSIFTWPAENVSGNSRAFQLQPTASDEISLVITNGQNVTQETLATINASSFSETNFLGAWWWIAFQRNGQDFDIWMGKSGVATNIYSATKSYTYDSERLDLYRIGCNGTPANNASSPIDGFIDEVAVRKGTPFDDMNLLGTVTCPTGPYTGNEQGMVDLYTFNTFGTTFPSNSAGSINQTSGSNISGSFNEYLLTFNPNATSTELNNIPGLGSIGYTAFQLGDVTVELVGPPTVVLTGVSASTSLGDLVPDSEVVGVSLQAGEGRLVNSATSVATPIPFAGLRSIDCGNQSATNLLSMPFQQPEYSYYNDFTVECFLRGDGTTNDGGFVDIAISNGSGNPDDLYLYIDGNNLQLNNYEFPGSGYRKKIEVNIGSRTTTDWYHVALVRKNNKYSIFWNGNRVVHDVDSAGNGTADFINITSDDAYLFKPFGGNNATGQGQVNNVNYGNGGNSVSGGTNKRWGGYMANIRTSYIAQYDPSLSTLEIPTAPFDDDASGQSYYYKNEETFQQLNSSTTLPTSFNDLNTTTAIGSITTEIGALGEANGSLLQAFEGNVNVQVVLDPVPVTGQNLTTSLGSAAGGVGVFAPATGQNLTVSLGSIDLPVSWGNVTTGTTSTWTPVDTGEKAIGP